MPSENPRLRRPKAAPAHEKRPARSVRHGIGLSDDFAWMKAENWREVLKDPSLLPRHIRQALLDENAHAKKVLGRLPVFIRELAAELRGRVKEDDSAPPEFDGPFKYGERFREGGQHPIVWRSPREGGEEHILLDGDALANGKDFFEIGGWEPSPDHALVAWACDNKGSEFYTIRVRGAVSGADSDRLAHASPEIVWGRDSRHLYYCLRDDQARPCRIMRHRLGQPQARDELIHEEDAAAGWFLDLGETSDGTLGTIEIANAETSEVWLIDLADPKARPRLIERRQDGIEYYADRQGDDLVIHTNTGEAVDFKIDTAPLAGPQRENWKSLVPHVPGRYIISVSCLKDTIIWSERRDANPRVVLKDWISGEEKAIEPGEAAYALSYSLPPEFDSGTIRLKYSSPRFPAEISDYDIAAGRQTLLKRDEIPSGHDPQAYVTERLHAPMNDGETVPVTLLYRRDLNLDGNTALFLEGYGAYGYPSPAEFDANLFSLVDRGFVYAIAHVRGGAEKGYGWYLDGKLMRKANTFNDFIGCARHLIAKRYTAAGRIVAYGASAGGMLMGAVANIAPELFAGIVAEVPFVDVVNTMLDGDLPLTPPEWKEWGDPVNDAAAFETMLSYSPYENISAQPYPAILALGGLADPRVTYWEPLKWVAQLRARMTAGGPIALQTNMDAGHGGASGRFDRLEEIAVAYAFALAAVRGEARRTGSGASV